MRLARSVRLTAAALVLGAAGLLAADVYKVDVDHVAVYFKISHLGFSTTYGRFNDVKGEFTLDEAGAGSKLSLTIATESVDTGNARRDAHLRNADFFDAKQFPAITFESKSMKKAGDKLWDVEGELTLHGVKKTLKVQVHQGNTGEMRGQTRTGGDVTFTIKRSEFGIDYGLPAVGDDVTMMISIEGIKQ